MTNGPTRATWRRVRSEPDPLLDLGYNMVDLDVIPVEDGSDRYMVLPRNEELLAEEAFIVASSTALCDVADRA